MHKYINSLPVFSVGLVFYLLPCMSCQTSNDFKRQHLFSSLFRHTLLFLYCVVIVDSVLLLFYLQIEHTQSSSKNKMCLTWKITQMKYKVRHVIQWSVLGERCFFTWGVFYYLHLVHSKAPLSRYGLTDKLKWKSENERQLWGEADVSSATISIYSVNLVTFLFCFTLGTPGISR